jgi:membrane associated rhomboid family serine protease
MEITGAISILIMVVTVIFSAKAFTNRTLFARYAFDVERILVHRDYKRLVTSGLLHVSWLHLIFNMLTLHAFAGSLAMIVTWWQFLIIYLGSLVGGNLFALLIHKNHGDYTAVGASGAVSGLIFASMVIMPGMAIQLMGILTLPGWLYTLLFVGVSIYGIRSRRDNIGHEAHLGGGLIGMLIAIAMWPGQVIYNYVPILLITLPTIALILFIVKRPDALLVQNLFFRNHHNYTVDDRYNISKRNRQEEIDRILEKIHKKGMGSLTRQEKQTLKEYSKLKE